MQGQGLEISPQKSLRTRTTINITLDNIPLEATKLSTDGTMDISDTVKLAYRKGVGVKTCHIPIQDQGTTSRFQLPFTTRIRPSMLQHRRPIPIVLSVCLPRCVLWPNGARQVCSVYTSRIGMLRRHFVRCHFPPPQVHPNPNHESGRIGDHNLTLELQSKATDRAKLCFGG